MASGFKASSEVYEVMVVTVTTELSREQLVIWAAGFFDGEGSVGLSKSRMGTNVVYLRIRVGQKTPEALVRFVLLWGGSIGHRSKPTTFYEWTKTHNSALNALLEMEPYLVVKRPHVQVARDLMSGVGHRGDTLIPGRGNVGLSPEETDRREALKEAMHILNQRVTQ